MRTVSAIHRWAGGLVGFLLALLGLTGAVLVWEGAWIALPGAGDPVSEAPARMAEIAERAQADGALAYITFASEEIGLHQLVYSDGSGAYVRQDGTVVDRWASQWERPELWLFDLHHHLFAGETGEIVTGIAGLAGLLFALTGVVLWWRSRRAFRPRLWPERLAPGPIVRHHRDLGLFTLPLLVLSMLTGIVMVFEPVRTVLVGTEERPETRMRADPGGGVGQVLELAKTRFPDAALRRLTLPARGGDPIVVRMRQPFEWTPNGRTQIRAYPDGTVIVQDAAAADRSASLSEKAYPVHSAKVGGLAWKLAMTLSGLALAMLGSLAMWSFWARRARKRGFRREGLRPGVSAG